MFPFTPHTTLRLDFAFGRFLYVSGLAIPGDDGKSAL